MSRFSFFSLRTRITLLVFAAVLPALLIIGYSGLERSRHAVDRVQQHALDLAEGAANLWQCRIRDARQILFTLSQLPQVQQHDKAECADIFSNLRANSEGFTGFLAVSPNGNLLASSFSSDQPYNFADKPWFREVNEGRPNVIDLIKSDRIDMIINTPLGRESFFDEQIVRRVATQRCMPCITTLSAARAAARAIQTIQRAKVSVKSLQEYHGMVK